MLPRTRTASHFLSQYNSNSSLDFSDDNAAESSSTGARPPENSDQFHLHIEQTNHLAQSAPNSYFLPRPEGESSPQAIPSPLVSPAARFLSLSFSPLPQFSQLSESPISTSSINQTIAGYTLGRVVGSGGSSTIWEAKSPTEEGVVAIKVVNQSRYNHVKDRERLRRESIIWSGLKHENILPLFRSSFTHPSSDQDFNVAWFITPYCPDGSLYNILHPAASSTPVLLPSDQVRTIFRQVTNGLRYLHIEKKLVHGDIKLENVLIDDGVCKIADFGMSKAFGDESSDDVHSSSSEEDNDGGIIMGKTNLTHHLSLRRSNPPHRQTYSGHGPRHLNTSEPPSTIKHTNSLRGSAPQKKRKFPQGSLPYAAPELFSESSQSAWKGKRKADPAQDIWALGVLLYVLLAGTFPFKDSYDARLVDKIVSGVFQMPLDIGPITEEILRGCLQVEIGKGARWDVTMVDDRGWGVGWTPSGSTVLTSESPFETSTTPGVTPTASRRTSHDAKANGPPPHSLLAMTKPKEVEEQHDELETRGRAHNIVNDLRTSSRSRTRSTSRTPLHLRNGEVLDPITTLAYAHHTHDVSTIPEDEQVGAERGRSSKVVDRRRPPLSHPNSNRTTTSRSRSRPPFESFHSDPNHTEALDPVVSRVSVSVERGRRGTVTTGMESRSPSPSVPPKTPVDATFTVSKKAWDDFWGPSIVQTHVE